MNTDEVDAIVLSACVQMPSLPAIAQVEAATGKPVRHGRGRHDATRCCGALGLEPVVPGAGALLSGAYPREAARMSATTFLYGAQVHANGIRQHYLRYGGAKARAAGAMRWSSFPASPAPPSPGASSPNVSGATSTPTCWTSGAAG